MSLLQETWAEIKGLPTDQLHKEFVDGLRVTVERLTRLAVILKELEGRGEVVKGVSESLLKLLRRIADGEVMAEVVVRFADRPQTMARVARLPMEQQAEILEDESKLADLPKPRHSQGRSRRNIEDENPLLAAAVATPKDLACMIAEMIQRHPDPRTVWGLVCAEPFVKSLVAPARRVG